ncbi:MAG: hypothetical protein ACFHXK_04505 [bacterium]
MDWPTYKTLSDHPLYWTRWMLEQCIDLLGQMQEDDLAACLQRSLYTKPLPVPQDHRGPDATRMYAVQLSHAQSQQVLKALRRAEEIGLSTAATARRGLGGFVAAWSEYVQAHENMDLKPPVSSCRR